MLIKSRITTIFKQSWLKAMIKFALVGVIGTIIDLGLLNLLYIKVGLALYLAIFWAFIVATVTVYAINNRWTYGHLGLPFRAQNLLKYTAIAAVGLAITEIVIHFLTVGNGFNYNIAKVIAIFLVFFWNFFTNRYWTFRAKG